jgi:DNA modification methylase
MALTERAEWHPDMPDEFKNQIVTGDCRGLSKAIPDASIDIIFTSPPYNVGMNYGTVSDKLPEDEFWQLQEIWLTDAYRIAADNSRMYIVVSETMLWTIRGIAEAIGWRYHQLLVWCKPNITNNTRISKDWNCFAEWCLLYHKGKRTPMLSKVQGINTHNWIVASSPQSNFNGNGKKLHPAQMSLKVAHAWLARTPGQIIYEPFAGVGTTCKAAKMLGKWYIGFEKDPDIAEIARKQLNPPFFELELEQAEMGLE